MSAPKLTAQEMRALAALLDRPTRTSAAAAVGITERTLRRWMRKPAFAAALREAQHEIVRETSSRLIAASGKAVTALLLVMVNKDAPPAARVAASKAVLEHAQRAYELGAVDERLGALEATKKVCR